MVRTLDILAEGQRWVAVNKPGGIGVEKHFNYDTVEKRALQQFRRTGASKLPYVGIVHRLDRPVSGVLLLARNKSTLVQLNDLFAQQKVRKVYHAIVTDPPPQDAGELRDFLLKDKFGKKAIAAKRPLPNAQLATLKYKIVAETNGKYLLEVRPETGKFHQIRVQLAGMGCPIMGDGLYGSLFPLPPNRIALHARTLQFIPPGAREAVEIVAPYPDDWMSGL
ncbi:MAG: RNA pseudouridine synthase [Bacteroidota bacterium]